MIKEKLKKLGCFVLAASMLLCNQMPVFADNLMSHVNIKPSQTVNLEDCSNVNLKLTVKLGSKDVTFTNGDSFEAAAGSDNAKALGAIKYYADKATDDDDFISHFSVNSTKSSANNAVMFDMMATDDGNVRALNMSSIGNNDKYFLGTGSNLDKFRNNFYVKKSGALYRFYFSSAEILNNFMVSDKAYYVDSSSKVKPISDYTSEFDFSDISAQITEDSPYPNISLKFVSGKMSTYDMSDLKYDIVLKTVNDKIVFAFPNASYLDDIKNSLINFADYNTSFFTETDVSPADENAIKTGSILKKGVRYLVSNFNTGDEIATTNKSYNSYNIRFYDEDTSGCLESTGKGSANSSPVVSDYTPDKTYRVVSVTRESEGSFNDYYCVTVKHDHVEKTTTNKISDPTCTAKGVNELITTCTDCGTEIKHEIQYVNALGHSAGTPTKENVIPLTCTAGGSYQEITRCTRCNEILKSELKTTPALGHNFGAWTKVDDVTSELINGALNKSLFDTQAIPKTLEKRTCATCGGYELIPDEIHEHSNYVTTNENVVDATCASEGGYDVVTKCGTCDEEISRTHVTTEKLVHTPGQSVVENEVKATCTTDGSYDEVVKCSVCGEELSRTARTIKALGHVSGTAVKENVVNPSCEKNGGYDEVVYCTRDEDGCNHSKLSSTHIVIPATGHPNKSARVDKVKESTCTKNGLYKAVVFCTDCNKVLTSKDIVVPATGHVAGKMTIENNVDPTCTAGGSYDEVVRCTTCNDVISRNTVKVAALGHAAGEPVIENMVKPTEKKEGGYDVAVYCTRDDHGCGHKELSRKHVVLDKLEHKHVAGTPVIENKTAATCDKKGRYDINVYCTDCKKLISSTHETVPALGHNYELTKTVDATCTKDGYNLYTCKNDASHTKKDVIKATGHNYIHQTDKYTAPTCTADGKYHEFDQCASCGDVKNERWNAVEALGHTFGAWTEIADKAQLTKELFAGAVNASELNFADLGKYDHVYRSDCARNDGYKLRVDKHEHSNLVTVKENVVNATCTKTGSFDEVVKCGVCGDVVSKDKITVPVKGHVAGKAVKTVVKEADCTNKGLIKSVVSCKNCGTVLASEEYETEKLGHVSGDPVIENKVDATTKKEGSYDIVVYCTRDDHGCGHKELSRKHVVVSKLKHEHTVGSPVIENRVAATCTRDGSYDINIYCTDCKKLLSSKHVTEKAFGHNYELTKTVDATCAKDGYNLYTCKNDASHTKKYVIKATGHEYSDPVVENKNDLKHDEVIYCAKCGKELSRKTVIDVQPETKPDTVLPETKPEEAAPAETVETPVEAVVETPATEQDSEADTEEAAPVTSDTSDTMTYVYVMLLGAAAVCAAAVLKRKKTNIKE